MLTPSHEEQSRRSLEDEKLSDETPSEGGLSSGLPRAGAARVIWMMSFCSSTSFYDCVHHYITSNEGRSCFSDMASLC